MTKIRPADPHPSPGSPDGASTSSKPYRAPVLKDHGSLEEHTRTAPLGGGGADVASS